MEKILLFSLGIARYGIKVTDVEQVLPGTGVTPAPGAPPFVRGVVSTGGDILPVLNLRKKFISSTAPEIDTGKTIVAKVGEDRYGLYVDSVGEIIDGGDEFTQGGEKMGEI